MHRAARNTWAGSRRSGGGLAPVYRRTGVDTVARRVIDFTASRRDRRVASPSLALLPHTCAAARVSSRDGPPDRHGSSAGPGRDLRTPSRRFSGSLYGTLSSRSRRLAVPRHCDDSTSSPPAAQCGSQAGRNTAPAWAFPGLSQLPGEQDERLPQTLLDALREFIAATLWVGCPPCAWRTARP